MENILPVLMKSIGMKTSQHPPCFPSPANGLPNGAELLLDTLLACGVDTVFGYPGGAALPLYDALYLRPALRHVLVRHEQAAVHAAEGYARSTGRVGVVLVTSGPGVSNTITGLLDAHSDAVQTVSAVRNALRVAASGKPGPVLLDVPKDVQLQRPRRQVEVTVPESGPAPSALPQPGLLQQAAEWLGSAKRPVLYGGGGLINAGPEACEAFKRLTRDWKLPTTLTLIGM